MEFRVLDLECRFRFIVWGLDFKFEIIFFNWLKFEFKFKIEVILWKYWNFKVLYLGFRVYGVLFFIFKNYKFKNKIKIYKMKLVKITTGYNIVKKIKMLLTKIRIMEYD